VSAPGRAFWEGTGVWGFGCWLPPHLLTFVEISLSLEASLTSTPNFLFRLRLLFSFSPPLSSYSSSCSLY